jgi:hypothetical protein
MVSVGLTADELASSALTGAAEKPKTQRIAARLALTCKQGAVGAVTIGFFASKALAPSLGEVPNLTKGG